MPVERAAIPLLVAFAAGSALATPPAVTTAVAATDAELLEFFAEFSAADGTFVDPFALDKVGKAVDKEIEKLEAEAKPAEKAAPPASKEDDDGQ